jgi:hypothetical protein
MLLYGLLIGFNSYASTAFIKDINYLINPKNTATTTRNKIETDILKEFIIYHKILFVNTMYLKINDKLGNENWNTFKYRLYIDCIQNKGVIVKNTTSGGGNPIQGIKDIYKGVKSRIKRRLQKRRMRKTQKNANALQKKLQKLKTNTIQVNPNNNVSDIKKNVILHVISKDAANNLNYKHYIHYYIYNNNNDLKVVNFILFNNVGYPFAIGNVNMYLSSDFKLKNNQSPKYNLVTRLNNFEYLNTDMLSNKNIKLYNNKLEEYKELYLEFNNDQKYAINSLPGIDAANLPTGTGNDKGLYARPQNANRINEEPDYDLPQPMRPNTKEGEYIEVVNSNQETSYTNPDLQSQRKNPNEDVNLRQDTYMEVTTQPKGKRT